MNQLSQITLSTLSMALLALMETKLVQAPVDVGILDSSMIEIAQAAEAWSPPIQITKGGTYTGRWRSLSQMFQQ